MMWIHTRPGNIHHQVHQEQNTKVTKDSFPGLSFLVSLVPSWCPWWECFSLLESETI